MKRVNLFGLLLAASAMTLASCGETRTPDKGSHVSAWPANSIASFLTKQEVKDGTVVPTFKADSYTFSVKKDESTNFEWFEMYAYTKDEASFTSYIEKAKGDSWTVVSDDKGAVATKGEVGMEFNKYSKDGVFKSVDFRIYSLAKKDASGGGSSSSSSSGTTSSTGGTTGTTTTGGGGGGGGGTIKPFPTSDLEEYLAEFLPGLDSSILVLPESKNTWTGAQVWMDEAQTVVGFEAECTDTGTPGSNAIEDTYKAALEKTSGWTVDDSSYEEEGYYATYSSDESFEILFYSYSSKFYWDIYPSDGGGSGGQTSEGFPIEAANEFLTTQNIASGVTMVYPSADKTWTYYSYSNIRKGLSFVATCEDNGTPKTDALEDAYKKLFEDATGWTVNDSQYDTVGYVATYNGHENEFEIVFFTQEAYEDEETGATVNGSFIMSIYDKTTVLSSTGFPATAANSFATSQEIADGVTLVYPAGSDTYYYREVLDSSEYPPYFEAVCDDNGTVGIDSIADIYKASLEDTTGWTVDDSQYDTKGYVATYSGHEDEFDITFYSDNGEFVFYLDVAESSGGGGDVSGDTASFTIADFAGQGTKDTGSEVTATVNGVTFTTNKGYAAEDALRCYQGAVVTITAPTGYVIVSLALTFGANDKGGLEASYTNINTASWTQTLAKQSRIATLDVTIAEA